MDSFRASQGVRRTIARCIRVIFIALFLWSIVIFAGVGFLLSVPPSIEALYFLVAVGFIMLVVFLLVLSALVFLSWMYICVLEVALLHDKKRIRVLGQPSQGSDAAHRITILGARSKIVQS